MADLVAADEPAPRPRPAQVRRFGVRRRRPAARAGRGGAGGDPQVVVPLPRRRPSGRRSARRAPTSRTCSSGGRSSTCRCPGPTVTPFSRTSEQRAAKLAAEGSRPIACHRALGAHALRDADPRCRGARRRRGSTTPRRRPAGSSLLRGIHDELFGKGSGYRAGGIDFTAFQLRATATTRRARPGDGASATGPISAARPGRLLAGASATPSRRRCSRRAPPVQVEGPGADRLPDTVIVVRPGQRGEPDAAGNYVIDLGGQTR